MGRIAPPGIPKTTSTPSASSRCAAPLAESFGQHEGGGEQHRARVRDSLTRERVGDTVRRTEHARCGLSEASPGDCPSVGEACCDFDRRAGELGRADDDVEAFWIEDEPTNGVAWCEPLDLQPVMALLESPGFAFPALVDPDERDARPALAREREGAFERPLPGVSTERREDRELGAPFEPNAGDRGAEIQIGLERRQRGVAPRGHQHRIGSEQRASRRERERAPEARQCIGAERDVPFVDVKPVLERHGGESAARFGHHFRADPVPRQADDRVCAAAHRLTFGR